MKNGEVAAGARADTMRKTTALLQPRNMDDDEDPFADIDEEDEDELGDNEIAIEDS